MAKSKPQPDPGQQKSWAKKLPDPSNPIVKWAFKSPLLLYRLGLGFLTGRIFMVMTTMGRKSGLPRRTVIEFHEYKGRKYVFSAWGEKSDWYRNILANPHITTQTWRGAESVLARRITSEAELSEAFEYARSNPTMRAVMKALDLGETQEDFLTHRDYFTFVTFDPVDEKTPEPLKVDLWWLWIILLAATLLLYP